MNIIEFNFPEEIALEQQLAEIQLALRPYEVAKEVAGEAIAIVAKSHEKLIDLKLSQNSLGDWRKKIIEASGYILEYVDEPEKANVRIEALQKEIESERISTAAKEVELRFSLENVAQLSESVKTLECELENLKALRSQEEASQSVLAENDELKKQIALLLKPVDRVMLDRLNEEAQGIGTPELDRYVVRELDGEVSSQWKIVQPDLESKSPEQDSGQENYREFATDAQGALSQPPAETLVDEEKIVFKTPNPDLLVGENEEQKKYEKKIAAARDIETAWEQGRGWEDMRGIARKYPGSLSEAAQNNPKFKKTLPGLIADFMIANSEISEDSLHPRLMEEVQSSKKEKELAAGIEQAAVALLDRRKDATWETIREILAQRPEVIEQARKIIRAKAHGRPSSKQKFIESLPGLLVNYIRETGDERDLEWVPFAADIRGALSFPQAETPIPIDGENAALETEQVNQSKKNENGINDLLDKITKPAIAENIEWRVISKACNKDPKNLEQLQLGCKTPVQVAFKNLIAQKLADYRLSHGSKAITDWIPSELLEQSDKLMAQQKQEEEEFPFAVGDEVYSTDRDDIDFNINGKVIGIDTKRGWVTVKFPDERTTQAIYKDLAKTKQLATA